MRCMRAAALLVLAALACGCRTRPDRPFPLAMERDVRTLDPHRHDDSPTHSVLANVYEPLVTFDRDMHVVPALAEGWSNPTDLVWRFRIRSGVRFHDGRTLTARDVAFSLERARRLKLAPYLLSVARIEVLDETSLELGTSAPEPVLLNKLASIGIVPAGTPDPIVRPVGTGPYRVVEHVPGVRLRLAANESYWAGAPSIRLAEFRVYPDGEARARALRTGEVLLARELNRSELAGAPERIRFVSHPGLVVVVLGVNFRTPGPLLSREVRQAIYWAVDPQELIERSGIEATPADEIVPPSVFGYLPGRNETRPRVEKARQLLLAAGYPKGFETTLELASSLAPSLGPPLAEQLARVGILVKVVGIEWQDLSDRLERRESPFFSIGWSCNGDASHILDGLLHTRREGSWGASNFGGYSNSGLDRAIERAGAILQPADRLVALHEAMGIALDDLPLIPLINRKRTYGVDERVRFEPRLNGQVLLRELSFSEQPRR